MKYDAATAAFMEKVAEDKPQEQSHARDLLSATKKVVNAIRRPAESLPKTLIGAATKELLKEGSMPALSVFGVLNEHYGKEWWDWEPETIWATLEREQGLHADDELKNMLQAFQAIALTNAPFEHWHIFEKVSHALNQNPVEFQIVQPVEIFEAALTLKILSAMRPGIAVEDEVCGYIAAVARSTGLVYLPKEYFPERCQKALDDMNNAMSLKELVAEYWPSYDGKTYPRDEATKHQLDMLLEVKTYASEAAR